MASSTCHPLDRSHKPAVLLDLSRHVPCQLNPESTSLARARFKSHLPTHFRRRFFHNRQADAGPFIRRTMGLLEHLKNLSGVRWRNSAVRGQFSGSKHAHAAQKPKGSIFHVVLSGLQTFMPEPAGHCPALLSSPPVFNSRQELAQTRARSH
jgi:hypothetical protein